MSGSTYHGRTVPRLIDDIVHHIPGNPSLLSRQDVPRLDDLDTINALRQVWTIPHYVFDKRIDNDGDHDGFSNPVPDRVYTTLEGVCIKTRHHVRIRISHPDSSSNVKLSTLPQNISMLYPSTSDPLSYSSDSNVETIAFHEPYHTNTRIEIAFFPPVISQHVIQEFSSEKIAQRFETFHHLKPQQPQQSRSECLLALYRLLHSPLEGDNDEQRFIKKDNPTLNIKLSPSVLESFGFILQQDGWLSPPIAGNSIEAIQSRRLLSWASLEANVLLRIERQAFNGIGDPFFQSSSLSQELYNSLNATNYQTLQQQHTNFGINNDLWWEYAYLGCVCDMSNRLIESAFDLQYNHDSANGHYYLKCLSDISCQRGSEVLQLKMAELQSLGAITCDDISSAYELLGIDNNNTNDEDLIEYYQLKINNTNDANQIASFKSALSIISKSRNSKVIQSYIDTANMDLDASYNALNVNSNTANDTITSVYELLVAQNPEKAIIYNKALIVIAQERGDPSLLTYIETYIENEKDSISLQEAYQDLGALSTMDQDSLITIFQIRIADMPNEILHLRACLGKIGIERDSIMIQNYLNTGEITTTSTTITNDWPVGLLNIGNTCYLNSLLQFYFTISPFKQLILGYESSDNKEDPDSPMIHSKRVGERIVSGWEIRRGAHFIRHLAKLFREMMYTSRKSIEPERVLVYLALVNPKEEHEERGKLLNDEQEEDEEDEARLDPQELGAISSQQDVSECIGNVLFQVEAALQPQSIDKDGEQVDAVKELFYGKTKQTIDFRDNESDIRIKEERFAHLIVDVADGPRDIYTALDGYFDADFVNLDGGSARRYLTISKLPPVLQIQVQRVQFDRKTYRPFKTTYPLTFYKTIYLDQYLDTENLEIKEKREEIWKWKGQQNKLKEELNILNGGNQLESVELTSEWLDEIKQDVEISKNLIDGLKETKIRLEKEIKDIEIKIKNLQELIKNQFQGMKKNGYKIHSVFIHRGEASYGHYWIYIYDYIYKIWRKYNDQYVTQSNDDEVFNDSNNNTATPFLLVYIKEELVDELTMAVDRRHFVDEPKQEQEQDDDDDPQEPLLDSEDDENNDSLKGEDLTMTSD